MINTIVGSGTLVTFPVLVSLGVPPVTATMSNAMGLIAGNITGAWAYRAELGHTRSTLVKLLPASVLGGVIGAALLTRLPESVFGVAAPFFIVVSLIFVITQPRLQRLVRERKSADGIESVADSQPPILYLLVFVAGIYGGYFVAAQGVLLLGILG
ncbi:MAG: sulfite exporter TauE/SafE family protein, partial [Propionibacterium sp.]|nr:sulfite exporter TauE/SafE family protein [Propionibacterium sp.]